MTAHAKIDALLDRLYAQVPALPDCDGRCWISCDQPEMSDREAQRFPARPQPGRTCPLLTPGGRCGDYDRRPMVCRLWGATASLPCPYGCRPAGGYLSPDEEFELYVRSLAVGGGSRAGWPRDFDPDQVIAAYRANVNGARDRYLAGRARAAADVSSRAVQDQTGPAHRPATTGRQPGQRSRPAEQTPG